MKSSLSLSRAFEVTPAVYRCHQALGDLQQGFFLFLVMFFFMVLSSVFPWFSRFGMCILPSMSHTIKAAILHKLCSLGTVRITAEEKGCRFRQAPCVFLA